MIHGKVFALLAVVVAVVTAQAAPANAPAAAPAAGPSATPSASPATAAPVASTTTADDLAIPVCNKTQLAEAENIYRKNERKLQCEKVMNIKDMFSPDVDFKKQCGMPACISALQELYNVFPDCRTENAEFKFRKMCASLLANCGVAPRDDKAPSSSAGSASGATKAPQTSDSTAPTFAPVGQTPAPSKTSSSTPKPSSHAAAVSTTTALALSAAAVIAGAVVA
ncbi:TPA: hypothetical protein N0F65_005909 [Lagenidium giganteum]|uniref:Uncharacterized protein n=1 Tax=Lagenidium giganteum TaxID=4803 RepID=A0AAV2ZB99_9STRA|nr:TPA: hypothetical protein N0F65_005909 [Lagenidium giganteum]